MSNKAKANTKVEATEATSTNDKMAAMLAGAQKAGEQQKQAADAVGEKGVKQTRKSSTLVKVAASSSKDENGNSLQRRNRNMTERKVAVFGSRVLGQAWVGTHIAFSTKTEEAMIKVVRNAPQKALEALQKADDLELLELSDLIPQGVELDMKKAELFDKYTADFTMVSRRAKVAAEAPVEEPAAEEAATEEQAES